LLVMGVLLLAMFLTALDQSIVATALPRIVSDLGGFHLVSWVITMYLLTSTVVIPVVGKLSDMFGRKYFLLVGIAVFVASSAACGIAPSMPLLIAGRGLQGIGSGIIVACVFATLGDLFTPVERARYFALFVGMFTLASVAGPTLGGFLTDGPGWRWCFLINLPIGLLAIAFILVRLPAGGGSGGRVRDIDFLGAGLLTVATVSFLLMVAWTSRELGWTHPATLGLGVVALLMTAAFIVQERRHPHAIIAVSLFANRAFVQAIVITIVASAGIFSAAQFLPTFVQTSLHGSATVSGLVITPQALGILTSSLVGGQLVSRTGRFKVQMIVGAAWASLAVFLMTQLGVGSSILLVALLMGLLGLGAGLVFPLTQVLVQAAVPQDQQGASAGIRQFFQLISQAFGVAVFGLILSSGYGSTFSARTETVAPQVPPATYAEFKDPTLGLDHARFDKAAEEVRALPGGGQLLEGLTLAQRQGMAHATDEIFFVAALASVVAFLVALTLKEIPLRRTFEVTEV
jgi:EmrB/QacA subfamily drug resistance transporter